MTDPATLRLVEQTCDKLLREGSDPTFTAVATATGLSRTTLYRDQCLRAVVEEHRSQSHDPRTLSGLTTEVAHLRTVVEALADRVRQHEEQLRQLTPHRKAN